MTHNQIQSRISRCIDLKRIIAEFEDEMKNHKAALVAEAESRDDNKTKTDGGGWSWRYEDADGAEVCVTQPGRKLKATINPLSKGFDRIREVAGKAFVHLFYQVPAYKPADDFAGLAEAALGAAEAKKLLKLVTTEASPQVAFEVAKQRSEA